MPKTLASASNNPLPKDSFRSDSLAELMTIAESRYELEFVPISAGGVVLEIAQIKNLKDILDNLIQTEGLADAIHTLPLWAKIWPASLILGHYLRHLNPEKHSALLEIGAGCGVTGLVAAALGFKDVCITDINEDALLFAKINILKNKLQDRVYAEKVDVEHHRLSTKFSCIVGSEILYLEHLHRPLLKFLRAQLTAVSNTTPCPEIILATDHRRTATPFFKLAGKHYQVLHKQIGAKEKTPQEQGQNAERHLLTLHRLTPFGAK